MNYIKKLQTENEKLKTAMLEIQEQLNIAAKHFSGSKFSMPCNDYAHIHEILAYTIEPIRNIINENL